MAETKYSNMQVVPEKFSQYTLDRTTALSTLVNSGIATGDAIVAGLINGTPEGGRFIMLPHYNALDGEDDVFGETDVSIGNVTTDAAHATLLMRQRAWGATDLARVLGGNDPMAAIGNLVSDWWLEKEQAIYLSILKGILDPTSGALKDHVNDISAGSAEAAYISDGATLDTKQLLGDHYGALGMAFMNSAVYTYLQKQNAITRQPIFNPADGTQVELESYLGYRIIVDDGMPVYDYVKDNSTGTITITTENLAQYQARCLDALVATDKVKAAASPVYDTYFLGSGAFIRQDGAPSGFIGTETDRDKIGAKNYLINRRCMVIHPRGLSWNTSATYSEGIYYPTNTMLATPENWTLKTDHKKVPIACLRHKIG